jgi:hypothetical protein
MSEIGVQVAVHRRDLVRGLPDDAALAVGSLIGALRHCAAQYGGAAGGHVHQSDDGRAFLVSLWWAADLGAEEQWKLWTEAGLPRCVVPAWLEPLPLRDGASMFCAGPSLAAVDLDAARGIALMRLPAVAGTAPEDHATAVGWRFLAALETADQRLRQVCRETLADLFAGAAPEAQPMAGTETEAASP